LHKFLFVVTGFALIILALDMHTKMNRSFKSLTSTSTTIDGKYELTTNIQYEEKYPRSFLNIIKPDGRFDEERPTYFSS